MDVLDTLAILGVPPGAIQIAIAQTTEFVRHDHNLLLDRWKLVAEENGMSSFRLHAGIVPDTLRNLNPVIYRPRGAGIILNPAVQGVKQEVAGDGKSERTCASGSRDRQVAGFLAEPSGMPMRAG